MFAPAALPLLPAAMRRADVQREKTGKATGTEVGSGGVVLTPARAQQWVPARPAFAAPALVLDEPTSPLDRGRPG